MKNANLRSDSNLNMVASMYKLKVIDEVQDYWEYLLSQPSSDQKSFYKRPNEWTPWFGNLQKIHNLEGAYKASKEDKRDASSKKRTSRYGGSPELVAKCLPECIGSHCDHLICELDYLLPQRYYTQMFLPITLTAYTLKRRQSKITNKSSRGTLPEEPAIIQDIFYHNIAELSPNRAEGLLLLSPKKYKSSNLIEARQRYASCILFLTFLLCTENRCNVSKSFLTFEAMTGSLHLFGRAIDPILTDLESVDRDDLANDPFKDQISAFCDCVFWDFQEWVLGKPIYEANWGVYENFRKNLKGIVPFINGRQSICSQKYEDLTLEAKEYIMEVFQKTSNQTIISSYFPLFLEKIALENQFKSSNSLSE